MDPVTPANPPCVRRILAPLPKHSRCASDHPRKKLVVGTSVVFSRSGNWQPSPCRAPPSEFLYPLRNQGFALGCCVLGLKRSQRTMRRLSVTWPARRSLEVDWKTPLKLIGHRPSIWIYILRATRRERTSLGGDQRFLLQRPPPLPHCAAAPGVQIPCAP